MTNYTLTNLKEYKENQYEIKLKDHLEKYIDYDELHFIESELIFFKNCFDTSNIKRIPFFSDVYNETFNITESIREYRYNYDDFELNGSGPNNIVFAEIFDFNVENNGFDLIRSEQLALSYSKILSFLNETKTKLTTQHQQLETEQTNPLNWQGTPLQFTELIKALRQSNLVSPEITQK